MSVVQSIRQAAVVAVNSLYNQQVSEADIAINTTKPEFEGEYTIVVFSFTKVSRQKPEETAQSIGEYLVANNPDLISKFNVVKGFLNLSINDAYWINFLQQQYKNAERGFLPSNGKKIMVEYSSPNTNKPLHLGHLRNNFLGYSIAEIIKANGYEVIKANLVNDRGIHICKSMLAWQLFAHGDTPQSTGIKGDHLVGDYYVKFETVVKEQAEVIIDRVLEKDFQDFDAAEAEKLEKLVTALHKPEVKENEEKTSKIMADIKEMSRNKTEIMQQAKIMLQQWEAGNPEVRELWAQMNSWVYEGFEQTYKRLGIDFDQMYFESETYLLGKDLVADGLEKGVLFKKEDNSVWIDLTADGLDQKLLLRGDGTSVYMTQDLGTARLKYDQYHMEKSMYVVADEQNYHFKVLQLILKKLGEPSADGIVHVSYGMVELPEGRMKSREGTVVDADDLIDEMVKTAEEKTKESGKNLDSFSEEELRELFDTVGIGAMKFFLLRVDPKKKMIFNPHESIELQGFTGPFIQYAYARIKSILRDLGELPSLEAVQFKEELLPLERELIILNEQFSNIIIEAYKELSPSIVANYAFQLAQLFNSFYAEKVDGVPTYSIIRASSEEKKLLRTQLIMLTANTIKQSMKLLGIRVPERM
ncbi:arginyl-tRNA synthetase [Chitinophaga terrae (ex Kim and Jung 2007)]|uniref:Arginine--tRNA ligase n=1 Tax=Chitinophaga terrae (ex Kim and Jung 2007) TaxID=408074 RepID=A0A1H4GHN1_9BACT|nr:arginine--tRNA ligase [Chitinophaga terrae (ex Kim and Jung 2007)]MDQ0109290.1 arginyl-tRNA synthetase [Chitinophaga terrae (ex Kim and Jung 2007)]GEP93439.1 arginine--tRNA ligase [Chitinophaga terrae (ex Kim and Jung 2007)]SEB08781.1 arginyl-tRNA synthetase [Chitinophaga terrae (ex Kim and Jung 2007)]